MVVEPDAEGAFRFVVRAPEPRRYRVRAGVGQEPASYAFACRHA